MSNCGSHITPVLFSPLFKLASAGQKKLNVRDLVRLQ